MPQSLAKVILHVVFSTKNRTPCISEKIRSELQALIVSHLSKIGSYVYDLYVNPDHAHILCTLPRTVTIAQLIYTIKTPSSAWIKTRGVPNFHWQDGYATFSVSASKLTIVSHYILNQPVHHQKQLYQDELKEFFHRYGVQFDENYVWD